MRRVLGLDHMITYTSAGESGASLRAAGWRLVHVRPARAGWDTPSRRRDDRRYTTGVARGLWLTGRP
ncbi:XF1762 family protein [Umezawaea beigongshangensis]|uniref:XF1762 family protein n=1 Tax=Umezawaea beigongshangensis TaxID=2780383 RepID=UPI0034D4F6FB